MTDSVIKGSLDDYLVGSAGGPVATAIGNNFYGINHRQTPGAIPKNKDVYGYTFFTRPQLNMQTDNLRNVRTLTPLLNTNSQSAQRIIRCALDPRLMAGYPVSGGSNRLSCPFVDNEMAFIPVLTNSLLSISGWPDLVLPDYTAPEGAYKETYAQVDGIIENYTSYDIEATFRNQKGDPIINLFYYWQFYMSKVFEGLLVPYPDFITENMIDYNTRIYRLVMDPEKKRVTKIAATGASFPNSLPFGANFDYSSEEPYNDQNAELTIRFKSIGAMYNDDILIKEFNQTVAVFNPMMDDANIDTYMVKIPDSLKSLFNNRGYPRIHPFTYELEWWVSSDFYRQRVAALTNIGLI